jgi:C1A family cysteine protease
MVTSLSTQQASDDAKQLFERWKQTVTPVARRERPRSCDAFSSTSDSTPVPS